MNALYILIVIWYLGILLKSCKMIYMYFNDKIKPLGIFTKGFFINFIDLVKIYNIYD